MRTTHVELGDGSIIESHLPPETFHPASATTDELREYGYLSALREYDVPGKDLFEYIAAHTTRILPTFEPAPAGSVTNETKLAPLKGRRISSDEERRGGPEDHLYWAGAVTAPLEPAQPEEAPTFDLVFGQFVIPSISVDHRRGAMSVSVGMDRRFGVRHSWTASISCFADSDDRIPYYRACLQYGSMSYGSWISNFPCAAGDSIALIVEKWPRDTKIGARVQWYNLSTGLSTEAISAQAGPFGTDAQWLVTSTASGNSWSVLPKFAPLMFTPAFAIRDDGTVVYPSTGWTFRMSWSEEILAHAVIGTDGSDPVTVLWRTYGDPRKIPHDW